MMGSPQVCVVGAGVVGLTSATLLQDALPHTATVTIVADKFFRDTTSNGAAGIFRPGLQFQGPTSALTRQWLQDAHNYYKRFVEEGPETGVKAISGYTFSAKHPHIVWNRLLEGLVEEYRQCTEEELALYRRPFGTFMTTVVTECGRHLPYLTHKFTSRGGKIKERRLASLEELADQYDAVLNCSGFGARELCDDITVTPIRGQVFKVRAPWIKNFYYEDYDTYIIPGFDHVTLGGIRNFDSYDDQINKHHSQDIWERCMALIPSLKDAQIIDEWVGWRPYRPTVRVEKELMVFDSGKTLKVVHNYGHGGYGVMTAPGTSIHAVKLLQEMLVSPKAKL